MAEEASQPPQSAPAQAAPQAMPPPVPEPPKKGPGLLWLAVVLGVAILGGAAYFLYTDRQKPAEKATMAPPSLVTQPSPAAPTATPTITSSDSVADIEKDLSGTTIESGNASEFDADLQSL